jgi:predicted membrane protein
VTEENLSWPYAKETTFKVSAIEIRFVKNLFLKFSLKTYLLSSCIVSSSLSFSMLVLLVSQNVMKLISSSVIESSTVMFCV